MNKLQIKEQEWWDKLEPDKQAAYIQAHPGSQKAQDATEKEEPEEKGKKSPEKRMAQIDNERESLNRQWNRLDQPGMDKSGEGKAEVMKKWDALDAEYDELEDGEEPSGDEPSSDQEVPDNEEDWAKEMGYDGGPIEDEYIESKEDYEDTQNPRYADDFPDEEKAEIEKRWKGAQKKYNAYVKKGVEKGWLDKDGFRDGLKVAFAGIPDEGGEKKPIPAKDLANDPNADTGPDSRGTAWSGDYFGAEDSAEWEEQYREAEEYADEDIDSPFYKEKLAQIKWFGEKQGWGDRGELSSSARTGNELNQETLTIDGKQYRRINESVKQKPKPKYEFSEFYQRFKK